MIQYLEDVHFYGCRLTDYHGLIIPVDTYEMMRGQGPIESETFWLQLVPQEIAFIDDIADIESETLAEEEPILKEQAMRRVGDVYQAQITNELLLIVPAMRYHADQQSFLDIVGSVDYWLTELAESEDVTLHAL